MGSVFVEVLTGLLRYLLFGASTWLIERGIATEEQTNQLVGGAVLLIVSIGLLVYRKAKDRWLVVQALEEQQGTTLERFQAKVKSTGSGATLKGLILATAIAPGLLWLPSCASVPTKQQAVLGLQFVQVQLEQTQDTERRLCNEAAFLSNPTAPITECAGPLSTTARLTTERHQAFAAAMANAYATQRKLGAALLLWRQGSPVPSEVSELETQVRTALDIAKALVPSEGGQALVDASQELLRQVQKIRQLITS